MADSVRYGILHRKDLGGVSLCGVENHGGIVVTTESTKFQDSVRETMFQVEAYIHARR
jgi:hypothetical protein